MVRAGDHDLDCRLRIQTEVGGGPPSAGTIDAMATELRLDPELAAVVKRARRRAEEMGELGGLAHAGISAS